MSVCCGCSCHVCAKTHSSGNHTSECWDNFMKVPLESWGPKEREARKALNCIRLELPTTVAQDLITCVLEAFEEIHNGTRPERTVASYEIRQEASVGDDTE
jgi:hypothetical protein